MIECVHWWLVSEPVTRYSRPNNHGDLVETTSQRCKKCGEERLNQCIIPPESVGPGVNRDADAIGRVW